MAFPSISLCFELRDFGAFFFLMNSNVDYDETDSDSDSEIDDYNYNSSTNNWSILTGDKIN